MRIVYVLTSLGMGGAEKQALAVAERMAKRGHTVALIVLRPRLKDVWPTALDTIYLDVRKTPASAFSALVSARQFLRCFKPDLIHGHSFHANIFARSLRLVVPRLKVLCTIHNVYEGGRWRMLAYWLTDPLCLRTTAVSEAIARRFIQLRAVSRRKCVVLTNGTDVAEFAPDPERRVHIRAEMGVEADPGKFIWIAAGRIVPAKDFSNLLRAFKQVREKLSDVELWIAGAATGFTDARTAGSTLRSGIGIAVEQGYQGKVRWLGLQRDMPALFDAADAFVSASAWEGMPLVVGEAMAMEKPVVVTDVGGVRELVGDAGIVIPPHDSSALAEAMMATTQRSREERAKLGHAARERIEQHFNIEARADAWETLYRGMLT